MNTEQPTISPTSDFMWRDGILVQKVIVTTIGSPDPIQTEWRPVLVGGMHVHGKKTPTWEDRNGKEPTTHRNGWDHVIEFDGGTSCNSPKKGFGHGYGSYRIDDGEIVRVTFGKGHSNNSAEIRTLIAALDHLSGIDAAGSVLCRGDSQIALKWIKCQQQPKSTGSENFLLAVGELREAVAKFPKVKGEWRRRNHSVALFGH